MSVAPSAKDFATFPAQQGQVVPGMQIAVAADQGQHPG
jgi:hypothetical protein